MNSNKTKVFIGALIAIVVGVGAIYLNNKSKDLSQVENEGVACTMDAMMCPDGSYVGRIPPACEFAKCPGF